MENTVTYEDVCKAVKKTGMICRGGFHPVEGDNIPGNPNTCIMVGNAGIQFWQSFESKRLKEPDPIEAWTQKALDQIARDLEAKVVFPFTGPPFLPFLEWAKRSEQLTESPIGPLIHPVYGLWHAYRGMFLFTEIIKLPENTDLDYLHPCDACSEKPCLLACPVNAVSEVGFHVKTCTNHIGSAEGSNCLSFGCLARRACPVGKDYLYPPAQANYHMQYFLDIFGDH